MIKINELNFQFRVVALGIKEVWQMMLIVRKKLDFEAILGS